MERHERGIDEIIRAAIEGGRFDNLPGEGKPLDLGKNPNLANEWELAFHLLEENGFAPEFIETRKAIEADLVSARADLVRVWTWRSQALAAGEDPALVGSQWSAAEARFRQAIEVLNKRIRDYNLIVPAVIFQRGLIDLEQELDSLDKPPSA